MEASYMTDPDERIENIPLVPDAAREQLNQRQATDYADHRESMLKWLLNLGKEPAKAEGYAQRTVKARAARIDRFYRWVWNTDGNGYTTSVTHTQADEYMTELAYKDHTKAHKANTMKSIRSLFKWRHYELGDDKWEPNIKFYHEGGTSQPRDYFTREERRRLREAALEYKSIPSYGSLSPEKRDEWREHLAQRFGVSKDTITQEDWNRANTWKYPSLVWTSLDAGLRPVEVGRAVVDWIDVDNAVLRIPRDDSSKNRENWIVGLQDRTANALKRWLREREQYDKYDDSDSVWLTRAGNPYSSNTLNNILDNLCEDAGIDRQSRSLSWYAIRHSTGTYMTDEKDLSAAQAQLRHKSERTTMRYDQTPVEERQDALDKMG